MPTSKAEVIYCLLVPVHDIETNSSLQGWWWILLSVSHLQGVCEPLKVDLPIARLSSESIALLLSLPYASGHGQKKWSSRGRRVSVGSMVSNSNPLSPL